MPNQLHDYGEEFVVKYVFTDEATRPASVTVGMYNDATDALGDSSDLTAITTEPNDGNYSRQTVALGATTDMATLQEEGDWRIDINDQEFNVTDTTGEVDSYFVVISFNADGDSAVTDHLFLTGSLGGTYDMSNYTSFTIQDTGLQIT